MVFNLVLWVALLVVCCKCGRVTLAREMFDEMPVKCLFCWNIMIKGLVEDGDYRMPCACSEKCSREVSEEIISRRRAWFSRALLWVL